MRFPAIPALCLLPFIAGCPERRFLPREVEIGLYDGNSGSRASPGLTLLMRGELLIVLAGYRLAGSSDTINSKVKEKSVQLRG